MKDTEVDIPKKTPMGVIVIIILALALLAACAACFNIMKDRQRLIAENQTALEQDKARTAQVQGAG